MTAENAPSPETHQDAYKNYADYNGVLRTWFVSFGLGALVLFMLHPDFVNLLRGQGHFLTVVLLFLAGCFAQIAVALINKFSSWHVYDATKRGVRTGGITDFFYNAFWVDKAIDIVTLGCFVIAIGLMVFDFVLTTRPTETAIQPADFTLKTACSEGAAKQFQRLGFNSNSMDSYKNHWNKKQGKCFIEIHVPGKDNFLTIEVFDVFENKRYASFNGHQFCDPTIVGVPACQIDSATIWLDGNDERVRGEYNFGFGGLKYGGVGNAATRTDFLERILPFMND